MGKAPIVVNIPFGNPNVMDNLQIKSQSGIEESSVWSSDIGGELKAHEAGVKAPKQTGAFDPAVNGRIYILPALPNAREGLSAEGR